MSYREFFHTGDTVVDAVTDELVDKLSWVLGIALVVFGGTFLTTWARFYYQSRGSAGRFSGGEPLTIPYAIPWFGSAYQMRDPHKLFQYARQVESTKRCCGFTDYFTRRKSEDGIPVRVRVGSTVFYVLSGAKSLRTLFNPSSASSVSKDSAQALLFRRYGMGESDLRIFTKDLTGTETVHDTNHPEDKRLRRKIQRLSIAHLGTGQSSNNLNSFVKYFAERLDTVRLGKMGSTTGTISLVLRKPMLEASLDSIVGTQFIKLNPAFNKDYWEAGEGLRPSAIYTPKILHGRKHRALAGALNASKKWINAAWENFDENNKDVEWEEHFGSRWIRKLVFALEEAGVSRDGQAITIFSLLQKMNSDSITCTAWVVLEAIQRPLIFARVITEIRDAIPTSPFDMQPKISSQKLTTDCPLLVSIYLEVLRTRSSSTFERRLIADLECDGYVLKAGNSVIAPSYLPAHDHLWSIPGHAAGFFWPERFIEMPKLKPSNPDEPSRYDQAIQPEHFFPFGGGDMICPGKIFAKEQILSAVALLLSKFELKPIVWLQEDGQLCFEPAKPKYSTADKGIARPDRDLRVLLTKIH